MAAWYKILSLTASCVSPQSWFESKGMLERRQGIGGGFWPAIYFSPPVTIDQSRLNRQEKGDKVTKNEISSILKCLGIWPNSWNWVLLILPDAWLSFINKFQRNDVFSMNFIHESSHGWHRHIRLSFSNNNAFEKWKISKYGMLKYHLEKIPTS